MPYAPVLGPNLYGKFNVSLIPTLLFLSMLYASWVAILPGFSAGLGYFSLLVISNNDNDNFQIFFAILSILEILLILKIL
jgi:hypothetical protein